MDTLQEALKITECMRENFYAMLEFVGKLKGEATRQKIISAKTKTLIEKNLIFTEEDDEMPRPLKYGQGSITKRIRKNKNGTEYKFYQIRYYDEYGIRHTATSRTQEDAYKILSQNNKRTLKNEKKKTIITFGTDFQEWYDTFRKPNISPKQNTSYQICIDKIPETIKQKPLRMVTETELQAHLNGLNSNKYRYWTKILLSSYFERVFAKGLIKANIGKLITAEQPIAPERQTLPKELEEKFIAALPACYRTHAIVAIYTGARSDELSRITQADIDLKNRLVYIKETKTLTKAERKTIPYKIRPAYLFPEIENIKFPLPSISKTRYSLAFRNASEKLNIKITPHDLRHTYATRLDAMGIDTEVILFHANKKMTKHYIHQNKVNKVLKEFEKLHKSTPMCTPIRPENSTEDKNPDE